jgi:glucose 1-dehydrogenase/3-oxoacyl-[acyl-carrier protein] reductase
MDLGLDAAVALVTGGTSGLGKASAESLAREGADVAICGRSAERLETARAAVDDAGSGRVLAVQADVTDDRGDIDDLLDQVVDAFDGLDHLVLSSAGPRAAPFLDTVDRDWYVTYDQLVMSVVRLCWQAHEHLAAGATGSVTVIASTTARESEPYFVLSVTHRHALLGLVGTLAREFAPDVRVNAVLPGPHETPYLEGLFEQAVEQGRYDSVAAARDVWQESIPRGSFGDPAQFGDVVAFLASDAAQYVTGAALPVDGGKLRST